MRRTAAYLLSTLPLAGCVANEDAPIGAGDAAPWTDDGITLGEPQACASPVALAYDEVGGAMGLAGATDPNAEHHHGGSAVVADLDGDLDTDIVLGFPQGPPILYRRVGDRFVAEALPQPVASFLLNLADIDDDGDLDLLAAGFRVLPVVLANDGAGNFSPLPMPELPVAGLRVRELSPGDLENDGDVDLYALTNSGGTNPAEYTDFVLEGDGRGGFVVAAEHVAAVGRGFDAVWTDTDADGDPDVYVVNDDGADFGPNRLLRNEGGTLIADGDRCSCELAHFGMGGDAADPDGDGYPDLYLTAVAHNVLLRNLGDGTFVDTALATGADPIATDGNMGWGAIWLDHDNDGVLDVLVAQGDRWFNGEARYVFESPLNLLHGGEDGFTDVGPALGLAQTGSFRGVVADDLNGDGVLDLLATEVVARPKLYLSKGCTENGWLRVEGPPHARIEVTSGGRTQVGWTTTESSFGGGHGSFLHIGLGSAQTVDHVRITTRDGRVLEGGTLEGRRVLRFE